MAQQIRSDMPFKPRLKEMAPTKRKTRRDRGRQEDPAHLDLVRDLPCIISGALPGPSRRNEAAHIRLSDANYGKAEPGMQAKPDDRWVLPLAPEVHQGGKDAQHSQGEAAFWARVGIDPLDACERLYDISATLRAVKVPRETIIQAMTKLVTNIRTEATGARR